MSTNPTPLTNTVRSPMTQRQTQWLVSKRRRAILHRLIIYPILLAGAVVMMIPLAWLISSSFKDSGRIFVFPPEWIPDPWRVENYPAVLEAIPFVRFLGNTVFVTTLALVGQLISSSLVAFGFARLRFPAATCSF